VSKTWSGNLLGLFIVVLGCLAGYGAYRISFEWGIVIGVVVALVGATIISPQAVKEGAKDFSSSASGLADLIPLKLGRRSTDPTALVPPPEEPKG
jgi:CDP-diglyceride synthetase